MTSVLLNGGQPAEQRNIQVPGVALDDVSVTEWRRKPWSSSGKNAPVALDDVSVTEWRTPRSFCISDRSLVALDDVSVTEWRYLIALGILSHTQVALDDVSVTEWRNIRELRRRIAWVLHSMTSVLLNGGPFEVKLDSNLNRCTR